MAKNSENWDERKKLGRPKNLKSPKMLWELACEYFKSVDESPFKREDFMRSGAKAGDIVKLKTPMPYTKEGLNNFLRKHRVLAKLEDYRVNKEKRYTDFAEIIRTIDSIIYNNKFSGAAVGAFNANIIARDLGLMEKTQMQLIEEQPLFPEPEED